MAAVGTERENEAPAVDLLEYPELVPLGCCWELTLVDGARKFVLDDEALRMWRKVAATWRLCHMRPAGVVEAARVEE